MATAVKSINGYGWRARSGRVVVCAALMGALSGCGFFLSSIGPDKDDLIEPNPEQTIDYTVAEMDAAALSATSNGPYEVFSAEFRSIDVEGDVIGVGDVLQISIWEDTDAGLYTNPGSKVATIDTVVDADGRIALPYVGRIRAAGRTPAQLRGAILGSLADRTSPDVTVTRTEQRSRPVTVQGAVDDPGVYQLGPNADRLLPVLAAAGGSNLDPHLVRVTIRRGEQSASAWLEEIYADPMGNVALRAGDVVILESRERFFNAFGAVRRPGRQRFTRRDMTLLDAMAAASGLDGNTAAPTGVFLIRRESPDIISQLTVLEQREAHGLETGVSELPGDQPVVYQLQFIDAEAMVVAGAFVIRENDTIYVTEAPYTAWRRVLSIVIPSLATAGGLTNLNNNLSGD